jgi:hypothetical protein
MFVNKFLLLLQHDLDSIMFKIQLRVVHKFNHNVVTRSLPNAPPNSLMDSTTSPKVKTIKGEGVGRIL